jgi:hypothetical protein
MPFNSSPLEFPLEWGDYSHLTAAIERHNASLAAETGRLPNQPATPITSGLGATSESDSAPTNIALPHRAISHSRPVNQLLDIFPPPLYTSRAARPRGHEYTTSNNQRHNISVQPQSSENNITLISRIRTSINRFIQNKRKAIDISRAKAYIRSISGEPGVVVHYAYAPNGPTIFRVMHNNELIYSGSTASNTDLEILNFVNTQSFSYRPITRFERPPPYDPRRRPSNDEFAESYVTHI